MTRIPYTLIPHLYHFGAYFRTRIKFELTMACPPKGRNFLLIKRKIGLIIGFRKEASGRHLLASLPYTQGVRGSSPLPPTTLEKAPKVVVIHSMVFYTTIVMIMMLGAC